jgi:hypothetical protein
METSSYVMAGCVAIVGYALPAMVAFIRQHPATPRITALNLCLGWTVIGWVAAFFWATTSRRHYRYRLMTVTSGAPQSTGSAHKAVNRPADSIPLHPGLTPPDNARPYADDATSPPAGAAHT